MKKAEMSVVRLIAITLGIFLLLFLIFGPGSALKDARQSWIRNLEIIAPDEPEEKITIISDMGCGELKEFFDGKSDVQQTDSNLITVYESYTIRLGCTEALSSNTLFEVAKIYYEKEEDEKSVPILEKLQRKNFNRNEVDYYLALNYLLFDTYEFIFESSNIPKYGKTLTMFIDLSGKDFAYKTDALFYSAEMLIRFEINEAGQKYYTDTKPDKSTLTKVSTPNIETALAKFKQYKEMQDSYKPRISEVEAYIKLLTEFEALPEPLLPLVPVDTTIVIPLLEEGSIISTEPS